MPRQPRYSMPQLMKAVEDHYNKYKEWPTVKALQKSTPASTERVALAIRNVQRTHASNVPLRHFNALAYLAGYDDPEQATAQLNKLEQHANPNRLSKRELMALLELLAPFQNHPPFNSMTKEGIRMRLPYDPRTKQAAEQLAETTGSTGLAQAWEDVREGLLQDATDPLRG